MAVLSVARSPFGTSGSSAGTRPVAAYADCRLVISIEGAEHGEGQSGGERAGRGGRVCLSGVRADVCAGAGVGGASPAGARGRGYVKAGASPGADGGLACDWQAESRLDWWGDAA